MKNLKIVFTSLIFSLLFCTYHVPDIDDQQPKALRLTPDILIKDTIAPEKGDRVDWRDFSYYKEATAIIIYMFGEPFKPHNVNGEITLFNFKGEVLEKRPVLPGKREYPFTISVNADEHYFFKLEAKSGFAPYMIETKVEILDPCMKCAPEETCCKPTGICCPPTHICVAGKCVEKGLCFPPCAPNKICFEGKCVEPCGGPCPKGKYCNIKINKCVSKKTSPSCPPCPEGTVCKRGRCVAVTSQPSCPQQCPEGTECNPTTGQCEETSSDIYGIIVNYYPVKDGTELIIDKGRVDGVRHNMNGYIIGVKNSNFKISEVFEGRCKAKVNLSKEVIANHSKVVIKP